MVKVSLWGGWHWDSREFITDVFLLRKLPGRGRCYHHQTHFYQVHIHCKKNCGAKEINLPLPARYYLGSSVPGDLSWLVLWLRLKRQAQVCALEVETFEKNIFRASAHRVHRAQIYWRYISVDEKKNMNSGTINYKETWRVSVHGAAGSRQRVWLCGTDNKYWLNQCRVHWMVNEFSIPMIYPAMVWEE